MKSCTSNSFTKKHRVAQLMFHSTRSLWNYPLESVQLFDDILVGIIVLLGQVSQDVVGITQHFVTVQKLSRRSGPLQFTRLIDQHENALECIRMHRSCMDSGPFECLFSYFQTMQYFDWTRCSCCEKVRFYNMNTLLILFIFLLHLQFFIAQSTFGVYMDNNFAG